MKKPIVLSALAVILIAVLGYALVAAKPPEAAAPSATSTPAAATSSAATSTAAAPKPAAPTPSAATSSAPAARPVFIAAPVSALSANGFTVHVNRAGESQDIAIVVNNATVFRRYAADGKTFVAMPREDVVVGFHVRVYGTRLPDGSVLAASVTEGQVKAATQ